MRKERQNWASSAPRCRWVFPGENGDRCILDVGHPGGHSISDEPGERPSEPGCERAGVIDRNRYGPGKAGYRGTSNSNARGNTSDRAARRQWMLRTFESDQGPGTCRCYRCGEVLRDETLTVDRIVPGCMGGKYRRNNVRPACAKCNSGTGGKERSK